MQEQEPRLKHFPAPFFATIMGLGGFTIALEKAESTLGLPAGISPIFLWLSGLLFIAITIGYAAKWIRYPGAVKKEFNHPIRMNFFPAFSIAMLVLSIATLHDYHALSKYLWYTGTIIQLVLTIHILSEWIHQQHFEVQHSNPAWFIPVVGNILVPVAGVEHAAGEASWFFFSFGLVFWILLQAIVLNRIIFHHQPLPGKLLPTLFIMIAPPAVGFIAYTKLGGEIDTLARVLYYTGLFITLLLLAQFKYFTKLKFFLSWWAYSFPMAAMTIATMVMFEKTGQGWFQTLAWVLLGLLSVLIAILVVMTIREMGRKGICVPE